MNLALLDRYLLYRLDAIKQSGTISNGNWPPEERLHALNLGYRECARRIRLQKKDHYTVRRSSTDSAVFIFNELYTPSSFRLVSGTAAYTLPPDYLGLRSMRALTSGRESVAFSFVEENSDEWLDRRRDVPPTGGTIERYLCTIIGERTLTVSPTPQETLDVEITYVTQPAPLRLYSTGSITLATALGVTTVTGVGTQFTEPYSGIRAGAELLVGTVAVAPTPNLQTRYRRVSAIGGDTTLTLADTYGADGGPGLLYQLASVPEFHEDWHPAIVAFAVYELLGKPVEVEGLAAPVAAAKAEWERWALALVPESAERQTQELPVAEDGWAIFGG